jgi:inner membrane protein
MLLARTAGNDARARAEERAGFWAAIVASNLPDADFILGGISGGGKLGYLLHHRGYTHTLLAIVPLALVSAWAGAKIGGITFRSSWKRLLALSVAALLLHVGADSCNDYGVHPFSPFNDRWFYGDTLFIIEPLILLALLPMAILSAGSLAARVGWSSLLALLMVLIWVGPFTPFPVATILSCWGAVLFLAQRKWVGVSVPWGVLVLTFVAFAAGARATSVKMVELFGPKVGSERRGFVHTPAPGNPLCWRVIATSVEEGGSYLARLGVLSLWPEVFRPEECFARVRAERTVLLSPVSLAPRSELHWIGEFRGEVAELRDLAARSCQFSALLRFIRVPYWQRVGTRMIAGDLRYDHESGLGFAEIDLDAPGECPARVPSWIPPFQTENL